MNNDRPIVALIHASPASVAPAQAAFAAEFPTAQLWNLVDDRLVVDADRAGGLTPALHDRMSTLIRYAVEGGAHAVQLSCSRYGPVAVAAHLAPYLPNHPLLDQAGPESGVGPISAAPFGSAGVLAISWAYIRMMGAEGLTAATKAAVLTANYVAKRLEGVFPVLYTGENGLVAHECILDLRPMTKETGISVDDVAKRLIDYGFHAPTMSFPVAGTLMVEPTESEDLAELDRFADAMIAIREEIDRVGAGEWSAEESPLRGAPHTTRALVGEWDRGYDRDLAVFPTGVDPDKYWPPVARIDQAYGDRNLVCACPPPEAFAE